MILGCACPSLSPRLDTVQPLLIILRSQVPQKVKINVRVWSAFVSFTFPWSTGLVKDQEGKIVGAKMRDELGGKEWTTKAKCIINATGPFTDSIRKMDDPSNPEIVCPSAGIHIILPDYYSPSNMGLLDPATSDGRVIFFLPWQVRTSKP